MSVLGNLMISAHPQVFSTYTASLLNTIQRARERMDRAVVPDLFVIYL